MMLHATDLTKFTLGKCNQEVAHSEADGWRGIYNVLLRETTKIEPTLSNGLSPYKSRTNVETRNI